MTGTKKRVYGPIKTGIVLLTMSVGAAGLLATTGAAVSAAAQPRPWCQGQAATIVGTYGDDTLRGTSGADVIVALDGDDLVMGMSGNDLICGGAGEDRLYGGDGHDVIFGLSDADVIVGGEGNDKLHGSTGPDNLHGSDGSDELFGGQGGDVLRGGPDRDVLDGGLHTDELDGGTGQDECVLASDALTGCEGSERILTSASLSTASSGEQYADEMVRLINVERAKVGLGALSRSDQLDQYAKEWAVEMSHQALPLDRSRHHSPAFTGSAIEFRDLPTSVAWTHAFENVGRLGGAMDDSPEKAIQRLFYATGGSGFTSSPTHYCNIVETAAAEVGVGTFVDSTGALWVSQVFWGSNSSVPAPVATCASTVSR